jgi:septal ring factor EnvC (AmiA/AmiB activator)
MKTTLSMMLVCLLAAMPGSANINAPLAEQLTNEARELRVIANDVAKQLKPRNADVTVVESKMEQFAQRAGEISRLVAEIEQSGPSLDERRTREFDRLKVLATTLNVFVDNKKTLMESGNAAQQREMIRAHSVGVAARADMIEKSVRKLSN